MCSRVERRQEEMEGEPERGPHARVFDDVGVYEAQSGKCLRMLLTDGFGEQVINLVAPNITCEGYYT